MLEYNVSNQHPIITTVGTEQTIIKNILMTDNLKHCHCETQGYISETVSTWISADLVKKFLPNFCQWSFMISSTLCFLVAKIDNHARTAQRPSFSRMWSEPCWLKEGGERVWVSEQNEGHCFLLLFLAKYIWWRSLTSAEALLSTQWEFASIHQIPKELPASWSLIQLHLQSLSHTGTKWDTQ